MSEERKARNALRKAGIEAEANDKVGGFTEKLAEAAEDVGRGTGRSSEVDKFVDVSARVIQESVETQAKIRRPDLHPEYDRDRNRMKRTKSFYFPAELTAKIFKKD